MSNPALCIVLSLVGSLCFVLFANLIKYTDREDIEYRWILTSLAYLLFFAGGGCDVAALQFGPIALKAPLGVANLLLDPPVAKLINSQPFTHRENMVLAAFGCIITVLASAHTPPVSTPDEIRQRWASPGVIAYVTLLCLFVSIITIILACIKSKWPTLCMVIAGMYSSLAALQLSTLFSLGAAATAVELSMMIIFTAVTLLLYNHIFKRGLRIKHERKSLDVAIFTSSNIVANIMNGGVVNADFAVFTPMLWIILVEGILLMVYMLVLY
jgi:hypothetical protein